MFKDLFKSKRVTALEEKVIAFEILLGNLQTDMRVHEEGRARQQKINNQYHASIAGVVERVTLLEARDSSTRFAHFNNKPKTESAE